MTNKIENKPWYKSKTKWGSLLIALGPLIGTIGAILTGQITFVVGSQALLIEIGAVLAVWGIRDIPLFNK